MSSFFSVFISVLFIFPCRDEIQLSLLHGVVLFCRAFPSTFPVILWGYFAFTYYLLYLIYMCFFSLPHFYFHLVPIFHMCSCFPVFVTYSVFPLNYFMKYQLLTLPLDAINNPYIALYYKILTYSHCSHYHSVPGSVSVASLRSCSTCVSFLCARSHHFFFLALHWVAVQSQG